jgi:hypothetical protein
MLSAMRQRRPSSTRPGPRRRDRRWRPPHCPNPDCVWHCATDTAGWKFQRRGARRVRRDPCHPILRFRCLPCGRWFSNSAFTLDYWKKLPRLAERLYDTTNNAGCLRQTGRPLGHSVTTMQRTQRQLARQSLLRELDYRRRLRGRLHEPVALDGQRNLVGSKHQMAEINSVYATASGYTLELEGFGIRQGVGQNPLRLTRRAASEQKWGLPDPQARRQSVRRLLRALDPLFAPGAVAEIRTDEEQDYEAPIREWARSRPVRHLTVSSRARRDGSNPLWMANHKHRLARHSLANLRRKTIAQSKRMWGLQDRLLTHRLWLNVTKGRSERTAAGRRTTPAMLLGLETRPLTGRDLFRQRLFPKRCGLPAELTALYEGRVNGWPNEVPTARVPKYTY